MFELDCFNVSEIKEYLKASHFAMQKKWGQNFLIDKKIASLLIKELGEIREKTIWEVGPGLGAMTGFLEASGAHLTLFEIDRGFVQFLAQKFKDNNNVKIIEGDVLKTFKKELHQTSLPDCLFGMLPYNIAISFLLFLFENSIIFDTMLIVVQKEVAVKMLSKVHKKTYSPLSIFCSYFYDGKKIKEVSPSSFWPQPHVASSIVLLKRKYTKDCINETLFVKLVNALFSSRRRTVKNNLYSSEFIKKKDDISTFNIEKILSSLSINPTSRAEDLEVEHYIKLANKLNSIL